MSESRLEAGRLGPFVDGYRAWLLERGYASGSVEDELRFLGVLGRWMVVEVLAVGQLNGDVIAAFVEARSADGSVPSVIARGSSCKRSVVSIRPSRRDRVSPGLLKFEYERSGPRRLRCKPVDAILG